MEESEAAKHPNILLSIRNLWRILLKVFNR